MSSKRLKAKGNIFSFFFVEIEVKGKWNYRTVNGKNNNSLANNVVYL